MRINVWLHAPNHAPAVVDTRINTVENVLDDIRQHWNEEPEGSQFFWLTDEQDNFLASIHRDPKDNERAVTMHANGSVEHHRCEYLFDENGHYEATEVTCLKYQPN